MKEIHFDEIVDNKSLIMRVIKINIILANKGVLINIKKKKKYLITVTNSIIYIIQKNEMRRDENLLLQDQY